MSSFGYTELSGGQLTVRWNLE